MATIDFAERSKQDELMDTEPVGFEEFRACLVDLARVNRLSLAYRPTLAFLDRLLEKGRSLGRPIEVVDVGSGYGDMLREIDAWALRRDVAVSLTGVDLNPWSRLAATEATSPSRKINWVTADAFAYDPPRRIDVVVSSLFAHHLPDPLVARFLGWMEANARLGWFVNDLHRHPLPYHFFRHFAKLARFHRFVQHDGPVSIARAFVASDWRLAAVLVEASRARRGVQCEPIQRDAQRALEHHRAMCERQHSSTPLGTGRRRRARDRRRGEQQHVRDAVVRRELDDLGVDHQHGSRLASPSR